MQVNPHYIANIEDQPTMCKHGALECAGDAQQLCVRKYAGTAGFWGFVQGQSKNVTAVGAYKLTVRFG